ncbi:hypothetical protein MPNT_210048 [Candidatus Methylacidithermus pantelleriae]|uniref:Uncharacterized protein n=1 Tax=Candidatus Methylacidithermus pantelleriae TaxID=2744239 RepID=A0A8J2FNQ1_9BACT|nr:hypothetical protein MPNT_210048 [Candidatus Methylacidithermus pantelleriae]
MCLSIWPYLQVLSGWSVLTRPRSIQRHARISRIGAFGRNCGRIISRSKLLTRLRSLLQRAPEPPSLPEVLDCPSLFDTFRSFPRFHLELRAISLPSPFLPAFWFLWTYFRVLPDLAFASIGQQSVRLVLTQTPAKMVFPSLCLVLRMPTLARYPGSPPNPSHGFFLPSKTFALASPAQNTAPALPVSMLW